MPSLPMGHNAIAKRIPHQGAMCLLDQVVACSPVHIECTAHSHRDPLNPLRTMTGLWALNGIEYAAQAMALHGALLALDGAPQGPGYLASVRGVRCHVDRLDMASIIRLRIRADRLAGDASQILYAFLLCDAVSDRVLIDGRATVVLNQSILPTTDRNGA